MIRQAQSYLAGAASSAALVGAAVAAFVLLASLQVFRDWAIPGLGDDNPVVALSRAPAPARAAAVALAPATRSLARPAQARSRAASPANGSSPADAVSPGSPRNPDGGPGSNGSKGPSGGGDPSGPNRPPPSAPPSPPSPSPSSAPAPTPQPGLQIPGGGSINTGAVQNTVHQALQQAGGAAGGVLNQTGLPNAAQGATDGLLGPGSPVGQVVDGTLGTANGVLHGTLSGPASP